MKRIIVGIFCVFLVRAAVNAENVDITKQKMRLFLNEKTGTFAIYTLDAKGKQTSVFDGQEKSQITAFYLNVNNRLYRLRKEPGTQVQAYQTQGGGALMYTMSAAEVIVEFSFIETLAGMPADTFRVDVKTRNITGDPQSFAVKGVFDTAFGERDGTFFSTAAQSSITSEYQIVTLATHQWVGAADYNNSLRFLLYGPGITIPQSVTLANKDILGMPNWDPGCYFGRSFTSMTSKNNAAVDIRWDPTILPNGATSTITFYLSMSTGEQPPAVVAFYPPTASIDVRDVSQPSIERASAPTGGVGVSPPAPSYDIQPRYDSTPAMPGYEPYPYNTPQSYQSQPYQSMPNGQTYPSAPAPYQPPQSYQGYQGYQGTGTPMYEVPVPKGYTPPSRIDTTPPITLYPAQPAKPFNMDYALELFDRIQQLSSGPGGINGINRDEIKRLNAELDMVLSQIIRKK
ncbi:MAG: hypothetical protein LBS97_05705 [Treponema sp.]|jgi:hypothetical protein|nr:hypothetical protein [Treponema sp.]